jgi:hypothetical protein
LRSAMESQTLSQISAAGPAGASLRWYICGPHSRPHSFRRQREVNRPQVSIDNKNVDNHVEHYRR